MTDEPLFPKPQGPEGPRPVLLNQPEGDSDTGGRKLELPPPGADGFGVETTFTVDNSTPGQIVVVPETFIAEPIFLSPGAVDDQPFFTGDSIAGWTHFDRSFTNNEVVFVRFVARESKRVNRISIMMPTGTGPAGTFDFGIYNYAMSQRLGSSGPVALGAFAAPAILTRSIPEVSLLRGVKYTMAAIGVKDPGPFATPVYVALSFGSTAPLRWNGNTMADWVTGTITLGSDTLPADLTPSFGAGGLNGASGPWAMLWHT